MLEIITVRGVELCAAGLVCMVMAMAAQAASVAVQVKDASGLAIAGGVVYAEPIIPRAFPKPTQKVSIEQKGRQFFPLVTAVQTNTEISFPNNDTVRHHVYSFSTPKVFELKLYSGVPGSPVLFDQPGTVVVGCNIHDQMLAYIHIVNTPYFSRTDQSGKAVLDGLAPGAYTLKYWHYKLPAAQAIHAQPLTVTMTDAKANIELGSKPVMVN